MQIVTLSKRIGRGLFAAMILALPLSSAACGRSACFEWSAGEGTCPAQEDAMSFFTDPGCTSRIESIDSEGSFDGKFCCYAVTQDDEAFIDAECAPPSPPGSGSGGFGGGGQVSVATGVGEGGFGGSIGEGGAGGGPSCVTCAEALSNNIIDPGELCPESAPLLDALIQCTCEGPCAMVCIDNICAAGRFATRECGTCIEDPQIGCGAQLVECSNDFLEG